MPRPRLRDPDELRGALIDAAGRLLAAHGPDALSLRRVAAAVDTSTTTVYGLFPEGKTGLLRAMFEEGFERFARTYADVPSSDDPVVDLLALGRAYRANAQANPHLYDLMFGRPVPGFQPDPVTIRRSQGPFDTLVRAVERCITAGRMAGEPLDVAFALFALVHGLASLELLDCLGTPDEADRRWTQALHDAVILRDPANARRQPDSPARRPPPESLA